MKGFFRLAKPRKETFLSDVKPCFLLYEKKFKTIFKINFAVIFSKYRNLVFGFALDGRILVLKTLFLHQIRHKKRLFQQFYKKLKKIKKFFKKVLTNRKICGKIGITQGQVPEAVKNECGSIAQLGEHLPYKQRVIGSSPIVPTILMAR